MSLNNIDAFTAFECNMILPDGVSCNKVILSDRANGHSILKSNNDGSVYITAFEMSSTPFSGNTGILFNVELTVGDNVDEGDYNIFLKNIKFTTTDAVEYNLPETSSVLSIKSFTAGDANNDGNTTITDVVTVVNYVHKKPLQSFFFIAADMNENNEVTITDATGILNLLLSQNTSAVAKAKSATMAKSVISSKGNSLYINDFTVIPGTDKTVSLHLDNTADYCSFSAEIQLPTGVSIIDKSLSQRFTDHQFTMSTHEGNMVILSAISFTNSSFMGNSGDVLIDLTLSIDENFKGGTMTISNAELGTATMDYCKPETTTTEITLDDIVGVNNIQQEESAPAEFYTLQGIKVEKEQLTPGIYIKRQGGKATKVVM